MARRCSIAVTDPARLCGGRPAGTNRTVASDSASRASSAIARCPIWIGSNVPPIRRSPAPGDHRRALQGSPPTPARPQPTRTVSPGRMPARRSSASAPSRSRSRWNRSADSSTRSRSGRRGARSARPRRERRPSDSRARSTDPARRRGDGPRRRPAPAAPPARRRREQLGERGSERPSPSPVDAEIATTGSPALPRAWRNAGQASVAEGRSTLLKATSMGLFSSAGSCASSSSRMTPWSHSGSRDGAVDDVHEHPGSLDVPQERVAEPRAGCSRPR